VGGLRQDQALAAHAGGTGDPAPVSPGARQRARTGCAADQLDDLAAQRPEADRFWLLYHVERLCSKAGVPVVCTQSLRGLHASVATDAGATSHVVASALGHSSPAVTHAHYIDGATARRARTRSVIGKVAPDPALRVVGATPSTAATRGHEGAAHARQAHHPQGGRGSRAARGWQRRNGRSRTDGRTHWFTRNVG
jgi:hypothetical protein